MTEVTTEVITWRSGPPPHTGWWAANTSKRPDIWSWYDADSGKWSFGVFDDVSAEQAAFASKLPRLYQSRVMWSDYYPKNARVPRVDPRDHHEALRLYVHYAKDIANAVRQPGGLLQQMVLWGIVENTKDALIALGYAKEV